MTSPKPSPNRQNVTVLRLPPRFQKLVEAYKRHAQVNGAPGGGGPPHMRHLRTPIVRAHSPWQTFCRIVAMAKGRTAWIFLLFCLAIISSALGLYSPLLMRNTVDCIRIFEKQPEADINRFLILLATLAGFYVFSSFLSFLQGWFSEKLAQDTLYDLRKNLFDHLNQVAIRFLDTKTHGEILSRAANDLSLVTSLVSRGIVAFFVSIVSLLCALGAMLYFSPLLTLAAVSTIPFSLLATKLLSRHIRNCFLSQQTVLGLLNGHVEEIFSAQKNVKAFNHEATAIDEFNALNREMMRISIWARILAGSMPPLMNMLNNLGYACLIGTGGYLAAQGLITIGTILAFTQYSRQFNGPLMNLANQYNDIQAALAGAERVFALLDEPPEADDGARQLPQPLQGKIDFDNVCFAYKEGEPVLQNFSLHVKPGQKIALVGTTGAGKTTIASLLMRFYEVNSGTITLDDIPITDIPRDALRSRIAMVLQDTWLFSGTIRDNIRYGNLNATDDQIEAAAASIGADAFIRRLPNGYDTPISDNGGNISQGQRQLICIARAILADAPILILDEATSNVDTRTELLVQQAMLHLMKGRTCIVIAHRLSTIRDADSIQVLEHGHIIEQGSRQQLLDAKGAYWRLEQSQYLGGDC